MFLISLYEIFSKLFLPTNNLEMYKVILKSMVLIILNFAQHKSNFIVRYLNLGIFLCGRNIYFQHEELFIILH